MKKLRAILVQKYDSAVSHFISTIDLKFQYRRNSDKNSATNEEFGAMHDEPRGRDGL